MTLQKEYLEGQRVAEREDEAKGLPKNRMD